MIHKFNPQIYPFRLWVSINPTFEEFDDSFHGLSLEMDRVEVPKSDFDNHDRLVTARTAAVASKDSEGWIGLLVSIYHPKRMSVGVACHEASHCADFITERFGITSGGFEDGEAHAYLIGWITDCIWQVKTGKFTI